MKSIDNTIKTIKSIRKQIADIDNRINECTNNRDYDKLSAERAIALFDLQSATAELNRLTTIEFEMTDEMLSESASNIVCDEFSKRANEIAAKYQNA